MDTQIAGSRIGLADCFTMNTFLRDFQWCLFFDLVIPATYGAGAANKITATEATGRNAS